MRKLASIQKIVSTDPIQVANKIEKETDLWDSEKILGYMTDLVRQASNSNNLYAWQSDFIRIIYSPEFSKEAYQRTSPFFGYYKVNMGNRRKDSSPMESYICSPMRHQGKTTVLSLIASYEVVKLENTVIFVSRNTLESMEAYARVSRYAGRKAANKIIFSKDFTHANELKDTYSRLTNISVLLDDCFELKQDYSQLLPPYNKLIAAGTPYTKTPIRMIGLPCNTYINANRLLMGEEG